MEKEAKERVIDAGGDPNNAEWLLSILAHYSLVSIAARTSFEAAEVQSHDLNEPPWGSIEGSLPLSSRVSVKMQG